MLRRGMKDIARAAGVSVSTVDRVLNQRGAVKPATRDAILEIANRMGYVADTPSGLKPLQLKAIIPGGTNAFLNQLSRGLALAAEPFSPRYNLTVARVENFEAAELCRELDASADMDAVAAIALDHPLVRESIRQLDKRGVPVITLVSDVANCGRRAYIGVDNRAAGRAAAHLLCLFMRQRSVGKVLLFRGSPSYRGHEERENGFRAKLSEEMPDLELVVAPETRDDIEETFSVASELLSTHPDTCGIYNVAGGNRGIAGALDQCENAHQISFIAHELTEYSRALILNRTVDALLDQNHQVEAATVVSTLARVASGDRIDELLPIPVQIFLPENLP